MTSGLSSIRQSGPYIQKKDVDVVSSKNISLNAPRLNYEALAKEALKVQTQLNECNIKRQLELGKIGAINKQRSGLDKEIEELQKEIQRAKTASKLETLNKNLQEKNKKKELNIQLYNSVTNQHKQAQKQYDQTLSTFKELNQKATTAYADYIIVIPGDEVVDTYHD